jgi:hypothetical protein
MQVIGVGTTHNTGDKNGDKKTWQAKRGMKREEADGEQTGLLEAS